MSVQAITCALAIRGVSASEKLVLLALSNYADEHMCCWPSQQRLADDTCLTTRTMRTVIQSLISRKLLSKVERRRSDGTQTSDLFTLHFAGEVTAQAEIISTSLQAENTSTGQAEIHVADRRKSTSQQAEIISTPTTFEPSVNHQEEEPPGRARATARRRRICPDDFLPSNADLQVGTDEGLTPGEIEREIAKFRDHEFRDPHSDWSRTLRKWLRTAAERKPHERSSQNQTRPTAYGRESRAIANLAGAAIALGRLGDTCGDDGGYAEPDPDLRRIAG